MTIANSFLPIFFSHSCVQVIGGMIVVKDIDRFGRELHVAKFSSKFVGSKVALKVSSEVSPYII